MTKLAFGAAVLLWGFVSYSLPVQAQSVTLNVCNTGKVDLDAILSSAGRVLNAKIRPATCAAVAKTEGAGMEAGYLGLAFTDSSGQYGAARRYDRVPYMGVKEMDAAKWLAMKARGETIPDPPRTLTLADGSRTVQRGNVTVPLQLYFQPAFPECQQVGTGGGATIGNTTIVEVTNICEDLGYTLVAETHLDSHEIYLESRSISGGLYQNSPLAPYRFTEKPEIDWAEAEAKRKAREQPLPVKWSDLLATLRNPVYPPQSGKLHEALPGYFVVRGTISGVEVLQHPTGPTTNIPVAHINFRESPAVPNWRPDSRPVSEFNICTERLDILQEKFGADFRTSMIGKTIEAHGEPFGEECYGQRASFQIYLGRQIRPVPSAVFAADARVWVPPAIAPPPPRRLPTIDEMAASIDTGAKVVAADLEFREKGRMRAACVEHADKASAQAYAANPRNFAAASEAINKETSACMQAADRYRHPYLSDGAPAQPAAQPIPAAEYAAAMERASQERMAAAQRQAQGAFERAKPCAQQLMRTYPDAGGVDPDGFQKGVQACVDAQLGNPPAASTPQAAPAPTRPVAPSTVPPIAPKAAPIPSTIAAPNPAPAPPPQTPAPPQAQSPTPRSAPLAAAPPAPAPALAPPTPAPSDAAAQAARAAQAEWDAKQKAAQEAQQRNQKYEACMLQAGKDHSDGGRLIDPQGYQKAVLACMQPQPASAAQQPAARPSR